MTNLQPKRPVFRRMSALPALSDFPKRTKSLALSQKCNVLLYDQRHI
jgi:hypothetical protein